MTKIKVKIEFTVTLESWEYEFPDTILDEFTSECDYELPSTKCVNVLSTELTDAYTVEEL